MQKMSWKELFTDDAQSPFKVQRIFFYQNLLDQINPRPPLLLLTNIFGDFSRMHAPPYAESGRSVKPIWLIVGLLLPTGWGAWEMKRVLESHGRRITTIRLFVGWNISNGVFLIIPQSGFIFENSSTNIEQKKFSGFLSCCTGNELLNGKSSLQQFRTDFLTLD